MKQDMNLDGIMRGAGKAFSRVMPYTGLLFFVMLSLMYAYVILQINNLSSAPVDDNTVTTEISKSPSLHVDPAAAGQLQSLKDNSSNVQTLFEQSRTNPFQE
jgi:hypothetical protein